MGIRTGIRRRAQGKLSLYPGALRQLHMTHHSNAPWVKPLTSYSTKIFRPWIITLRLPFDFRSPSNPTCFRASSSVIMPKTSLPRVTAMRFTSFFSITSRASVILSWGLTEGLSATPSSIGMMISSTASRFMVGLSVTLPPKGGEGVCRGEIVIGYTSVLPLKRKIRTRGGRGKLIAHNLLILKQTEHCQPERIMRGIAGLSTRKLQLKRTTGSEDKETH